MTNNILILSGGISGGSWKMFERLICILLEMGYRVTVIALYDIRQKGNYKPKYYNREQLRLHLIPYLELNKYVHILEKNTILNLVFYIPLFIFTVVYLFVYHKRFRCILSNGIMSSFGAILLKKLLNPNYRIYAWVHMAGIHKRQNRLIISLAKYIDRFIANSLDVESQLINNLGISRRNIIVVPNWIDEITLDEDSIEHLQQKYNDLISYRFRVIYVGRFVYYKHFLTYLQVAERLTSYLPSIAFIFVGDGELFYHLEKVISNNKNVFYFKNIPEEDLRYLFRISNITLTYADENYFGLTAYESLIEGTPILYINITCTPYKYEKRIKIEKDLIHDSLGHRVNDNIDEICSLIVDLYNKGEPTITIREECKLYAKRYNSKQNGMIIIDKLLKFNGISRQEGNNLREN